MSAQEQPVVPPQNPFLPIPSRNGHQNRPRNVPPPPPQEEMTPLEYARRRRDVDESFWDWTDAAPKSVNIVFWGGGEAQIREQAVAIDCWKYPDNNAVQGPGPRYIVDSEIEDWCKSPTPSEEGKTPQTRMRWIAKSYPRMDHVPTPIPFTAHSFEAILSTFGLPHVHGYITSRASGACGRFQTEDNKHVFVCTRPLTAIAISTVGCYDPKTNTSEGYIIPGHTQNLEGALIGIPEQFKTHSHPILMFVLMAEIQLQNLAQQADSINGDLVRIEISTNWNDFDNIFVEKHATAESKDYRELRKRLGRVGIACALQQGELNSMRFLIAFLIEQLNTMDTWLDKERCEELRHTTKKLMERLKYAASNAEHLIYIGGAQKRIETQQAVLLSLISQQDNQMNFQLSRDMRRIAKETKSDGSTMKLLAVLGTIFLPGTFVSTFFAMPMLNWGAPTAKEIVGPRFWVYWAFSVPFTIVTMILVGGWLAYQNRLKATIGDGNFGIQDTPDNAPTVMNAVSNSEMEVITADMHNDGFMRRYLGVKRASYYADRIPSALRHRRRNSHVEREVEVENGIGIDLKD